MFAYFNSNDESGVLGEFGGAGRTRAGGNTPPVLSLPTKEQQQKIDEAIRTLMEHVSDACQVPWAKSPSKTAILAFVRWKASFMSKRRPRVESKEHERRMVLREGFRQIEGTWDVVANGASVVYLTVF